MRIRFASLRCGPAAILRTSRKEPRRSESASAFLRRHRTVIRRMVARSTGKHELALDTVLREMIVRSRELKLRAVGSKRDLIGDFAILLAARSAEFVYRGRDWHAL